jgi:integrase/recombinase XerD
MSETGTSSLHDALDMFLLDCQVRRLTTSTIAFYRLKISAFFRWLADRDLTDLEDITARHIKRYIVHLQDKGLTDHSQHDYIRPVRTFFAYCVRDDLLDETPFDKIKMPKIAEKAPVTLTDDEIKTVLRKVTWRRNRLIVRFILDSGIRASELLALNIGDIDMETGVVTVTLGKQQKSRFTSIGATTRKELKRYLLLHKGAGPKDPLIVGMDKKAARLTKEGLMHTFRRMRNETGVESLTAHTLRRTMATKALENGMDAYVLARMLGHADMQMLRRYIRLNKKPVQDAADKFSLIDNLFE